MSSEKRRIRNDVIMIGSIVALIVLGVRLFSDRRYTLVSMMIAFLACFFFYLTYEKKEGSIRRMVMIAVMTTITVISRLIFGVVPGFKPMSAIIILTGIFMGPECGFLVGSLSALTSNIFFGQGPWTPFQIQHCPDIHNTGIQHSHQHAPDYQRYAVAQHFSHPRKSGQKSDDSPCQHLKRSPWPLSKENIRSQCREGSYQKPTLRPHKNTGQNDNG